MKKTVSPPAKRSVGRPKAEFTPSHVETLAAMQCTQAEMAAFFGVALSTIERHRAEEPEFRDAIDRGYAMAKLRVRRKQFELLDANNVTMAIWLGKQLLDQSDHMKHSGGLAFTLADIDQIVDAGSNDKPVKSA
jgi:hypothetical protein